MRVLPRGAPWKDEVPKQMGASRPERASDLPDSAPHHWSSAGSSVNVVGGGAGGEWGELPAGVGPHIAFIQLPGTFPVYLSQKQNKAFIVQVVQPLCPPRCPSP